MAYLPTDLHDGGMPVTASASCLIAKAQSLSAVTPLITGFYTTFNPRRYGNMPSVPGCLTLGLDLRCDWTS